VFGALRVKDGKSLSFTSRSRNSKGYIKLLQNIERKAVGVRTTSKAAEASEAHFCVPSLRNRALILQL
jgi:hypothetical protein